MNPRPAYETLRGYAQLARVSNLPTCWTNVLVGGAAGASCGPVHWGHITAIGFAISLIYTAGMALNDAIDADTDRLKSPHRPIPSGQVSIRGAYTFAVAGFTLGLAVLVAIGTATAVFGLALVAAVVAYDMLHKRWAASVLLLGVCRGLIYLIAAGAGFTLGGGAAILELSANITVNMPPQNAVWFASSMGLYTAVIAFIARRENTPHVGLRRWLAITLPIITLIAACGAWPTERPISVITLAGLAMVLWLAHAARLILMPPPQTQRAVMAWLSGICLVDAYFLTLIDRPGLATAAVGCFIITAWGHRHVSGT